MRNKFNIWPYRIWGICLIAIGLSGIFCNELLLYKVDSFENKKHDAEVDSLCSKYTSQFDTENLQPNEQKNLKLLARKIAYTRCFASWTVGSYTGITHVIIFNVIISFLGIIVILVGSMRHMRREIENIRNPLEGKEIQTRSKTSRITKHIIILIVLFFLIGSSIVSFFEVKNGIKCVKDIGILWGMLTYSFISISIITNYLINYFREKECN